MDKVLAAMTEVINLSYVSVVPGFHLLTILSKTNNNNNKKEANNQCFS